MLNCGDFHAEWELTKTPPTMLFKFKGGPKHNLEIDAFYCDQFSFVILFLDNMKTGGDASNSELGSQLCEAGEG